MLELDGVMDDVSDETADWPISIARDLRPVYGAASEHAARLALDEVEKKWGERYPAIIKLWENAWA